MQFWNLGYCLLDFRFCFHQSSKTFNTDTNTVAFNSPDGLPLEIFESRIINACSVVRTDAVVWGYEEDHRDVAFIIILSSVMNLQSKNSTSTAKPLLGTGNKIFANKTPAHTEAISRLRKLVLLAQLQPPVQLTLLVWSLTAILHLLLPANQIAERITIHFDLTNSSSAIKTSRKQPHLSWCKTTGTQELAIKLFTKTALVMPSMCPISQLQRPPV